MRREIGWGIIGGGEVVERKSGPGFLIPGLSRVVSVVRRRYEDAVSTASRLGALSAYSNISDLLRDPYVDAVYIATPPGLHYEQAAQCLIAGKPVYIEKPFTTSYDSACKLISLSEKMSVPIYVAHYRRAIDRFTKIKDIVDCNIGEIFDFTLRLTRRLCDDAGHPWLYNVALSGGGKFADIAPHSIDLLTYYFGRADFIGASTRHIKSPNGREDCVAIAFGFSSGVIGTASYNFMGTEKADFVEIFAEFGSVNFSVHGERDVVVNYKSGTSEVIKSPLPNIIEGPMIVEVVRDICGIGGKPCYGKDALETVRIMECVLNTLR